jgi:magnesium-transporting ATPase (P-type)
MQAFISNDFVETLIRFMLCLIVNWSIVNFLYFKKSRRRDFYFTFMIISVVIYFLVYLMMGMERGKATMGVGLGLFGIFSIMRYRTDSMPVREMTYLFVVVCLAVVHAMSTDVPFYELLVIDAITVTAIMAFEKTLKVSATRLVQYDRIELIKPERREELKADLAQRLGIQVLKVEVGGVDFLRDMAVLRVSYVGENTTDINNKLKLKEADYAHV